jgi:hypothetical protein
LNQDEIIILAIFWFEVRSLPLIPIKSHLYLSIRFYYETIKLMILFYDDIFEEKLWTKVIRNIYQYQVSWKQGIIYSKEYSLSHWMDVEIWDEGHGIVGVSMSQNIGGRTKRTASFGPNMQMVGAFSLLTSVRFMSFALRSLHHSQSLSYSAVCIPDKKLRLMIMSVIVYRP